MVRAARQLGKARARHAGRHGCDRCGGCGPGEPVAILLRVAGECDGALSVPIAYRRRRARRAAYSAVQAGTHCYDLSPDCHWAFHTFSTFDSPPVVDLVSVPDLQRQRVLENNEKLRANASSLLDPPVEFLKVKAGDGATLDGWLLRPRNFDPAKKYPVVVYVYGEPFGLTATNAWPGKRGLFHRALAASGYVVVSFDNRGTPAPKGRAWRKSIYGMVGVLSSKDQTDAILALARERSWIDRDRIAFGAGAAAAPTR